MIPPQISPSHVSGFTATFRSVSYNNGPPSFSVTVESLEVDGMGTIPVAEQCKSVGSDAGASKHVQTLLSELRNGDIVSAQAEHRSERDSRVREAKAQWESLISLALVVLQYKTGADHVEPLPTPHDGAFFPPHTPTANARFLFDEQREFRVPSGREEGRVARPFRMATEESGLGYEFRSNSIHLDRLIAHKRIEYMDPTHPMTVAFRAIEKALGFVEVESCSLDGYGVRFDMVSIEPDFGGPLDVPESLGGGDTLLPVYRGVDGKLRASYSITLDFDGVRALCEGGSR